MVKAKNISTNTTENYSDLVQHVKLGEYVISVKGKKPKKISSIQTKDCPLPYVNIKAFEKGVIEEYTDGIGCVLCEEGDFLMVWDGSRSGYVGKGIRGALGSTLVKLNFPNIDNNYAYYFLQSKYAEINTRAKGVGIPHVDPNLLWNYELRIPSLKEQQAIVSKIEELFSELDKGIESLKKAQQQLKVYRQSVLKWAFEGRLTNETNIRWGLLKDVIEGVEYGSASKSKKQGLVPVLRMGNIQNGRFEWDDLVYTDNKEEIKKYLLNKDDVLFNRTNSPEWVGKTAIYQGEQPAIFAGYLIRINRKENALDPNYLNYFLNSQIAKNHGNKVKSFGVNQSNINGTKLKQYPFPLCALNSQIAIVKEIEYRLSVCDKIEETIESSLQQAEQLKQSILKKAFEGKLINDQVQANTYKPKSEYFYQLQLLGLIAKASKQKKIEHGEMTLAKYSYLLDRICGIPTYYDYQRWHLGPYPPAMKKAINNKTYFKKTGNHIEVVNEKTLLKTSNPLTEKIEAAANNLAEIFSKYNTKDRAHKTELLATVCKVIEDIQSTDLAAVRASMKEWKIELKGSKYKNKAEKFDEKETKGCVEFMAQNNWIGKLIKQKAEPSCWEE